MRETTTTTVCCSLRIQNRRYPPPRFDVPRPRRGPLGTPLRSAQTAPRILDAENR